MGADSNNSDLKQVPVYLICGNDEYLVSEKSRRIVNRLCPEADQSFGLEIVDARVGNAAEAGAAVKQCIEGLRTIGFLGSSKVVWLRDVNFFAEGQLAKAAEVKDWMQRLTDEIKAGIPQGQTLVVSASKVDKRSAFFKACDGAGQVFEYEVAGQSYQAERQARERAQQVLAKAGLKMGHDVLDYFLSRTGTDTRQIVQEVEKLVLYLDGETQVTREVVDKLVCMSREEMSWSLADAVVKCDVPGAVRLIRQLAAQRESAMGIIFALGSRFHQLHVINACLKRGWMKVIQHGRRTDTQWEQGEDVDRALDGFGRDDPRKLHPYRAAMLAGDAQKCSARELEWCRTKILKTHELLVSSPVPGELLLELLVAELAGRRSVKKRKAS